MSENQVYHVMLRGNDRQKIFIDQEDKERIIATIKEKREGSRYLIYAFCVMDNHIHLVIKEGEENLSRIIKRIATSYAFYFNQKYKRSGHVFQDRFRSENIENEKYLLAVIRYVHQNPEKAGIGTIESYRWSSYWEYLKKETGLVETGEILGMVSEDQEKAIREFKRFNREKADEECIDVAEEKETDPEKIRDMVDGYLRAKGIDRAELRSPGGRGSREEIVKLLQEKTGLSLRGIAQELGLNREMVRLAAMSRAPSD